MIKVKFFASLREQVGIDETSLAIDQPLSLQQVWAQLSKIDMPANTLMAINHDYADKTAQAQSGDEVAFFPPVTGG